MSSARPSAVLLVLLLVGAASFVVRGVHHRRVTTLGSGEWVTTDPDTLYHARRLERLLEEGTIDGRDPMLDFPHGARIPWPPAYTAVLGAVLGPFAPPVGEGRHGWIERGVASVPRVLGALGTMLAALAAGWLARSAVAGLAAGVLHALCLAAIAYSKSGNGDHHAWVALLAAAMLLFVSLGASERALGSRRLGMGWGAAAGGVAGVLIASWVGAVLYVLQVQLALGLLLVLRRARPAPGLAPFGLAFHLTALFVCLPPVLASPWTDELPWIVVNLSWFHPAWLAAGALVFAPLFLVERRPRALRAYPWIVLAALALVGAVLFFGGTPVGAGIAEGFAWVSRADEFMSGIAESRSWLEPGDGPSAFEELGWGLALLPFAWALALFAALRGRHELLPWVVAAPLLALQAARQARFGDALSIPMVVLLGYALARALDAGRLRALPGAARTAVALAVALALSSTTLAETVRRARTPGGGSERPSALAVRATGDWLRKRHGDARDACVLAQWTWGHAIEWGAGLPTVATNFGTYVSEDSFRDPSRFFLAEDEPAALALLDRRRARWVLVTSDLPNHLNFLIRTASPERAERYVAAASEGPRAGRVRPEWFLTMGARLLFDGTVFGPLGAGTRPLAGLRLVHASPIPDPARRLRGPNDVSPAAFLWERVPGAAVEAEGEPGDVLEVRVRVRYPRAQRELVFADRAVADAGGVARLRVPYATESANGDGWVSDGDAVWTFARRRGALRIEEEDVRAGGRVVVGE